MLTAQSADFSLQSNAALKLWQDKTTSIWKATIPGDVSLILITPQRSPEFLALSYAETTIQWDGTGLGLYVPVYPGKNRLVVHNLDAAGATSEAILELERKEMWPKLTRFRPSQWNDPVSKRSMMYRYFEPDTTKHGKGPFPLVVFLHGGNERGSDNQAQILASQGANIWTEPTEQEKRPCFVLAPQARQSSQGGFSLTRGDDNIEINLSKVFVEAPDLSDMMRLVQEFSRYYNVDRSRIYVSGFSQGGFGAAAAMMHPSQLFAAAHLVCGGGNPQLAHTMKNQPLWIVHAKTDPVVPVEFSRNFVYALRQAGARVVYQEYGLDVFLRPNGHFAWVPAYQNAAMRSWLFTQQK